MNQFWSNLLKSLRNVLGVTEARDLIRVSLMAGPLFNDREAMIAITFLIDPY